MIFDSDIIMTLHTVVCDIYALWFMEVNNVDTAAKKQLKSRKYLSNAHLCNIRFIITLPFGL